MGRQSKKMRELLAANDYLIAPCAYDALSARAIEAAGFPIAGTTGYGMHGVVLGQPDTGLLALNETVSILSKMVDAVDIPILADAEGGYGSAMNVIRAVREYEKAGVAGLFIEDQKQPPNCPFIKAPEVISTEEMVGKKVMVLVNLKPAKLAGVLSEGMLLCAEDENGTLSLMTPEKSMPSGAEIC